MPVPGWDDRGPRGAVVVRKRDRPGFGPDGADPDRFGRGNSRLGITRPSGSRVAASPAVQTLYRMNESYSFDPINPSAPANVVLLTFDDGLSEAVATTMLDTLDKYRAKRSFRQRLSRPAAPGVVTAHRRSGTCDRQSFLGSRQSQETRCRRNRAADHRRADLVSQVVGKRRGSSARPTAPAMTRSGRSLRNRACST